MTIPPRHVRDALPDQADASVIVTQVIPGTGPTDLGKAEDAPHATGDVGVEMLAVRNDAGGPLAGDLDYIPLTTDATGSLRVTATAVVAGAVTVSGPVAHDAAAAAVNPVLEGGYASAAAPADVSADNDAVRAWNLRNGARAVQLTAAGALIGGDAANGLDVDVTRMAALVAGAAIIGQVGIDQTVPGTTNKVSLSDETTKVIGTVNQGTSPWVGSSAGPIAHDVAAGAVNPLLEGGYASAAAPADVSTDGDAVRAWNLRNGARAVQVTAGGALVGGDAANGLDVDVTRVIPGTAASNLGKAEDAAHVAGDVGVMALAVRRDPATALASDGAYIPLTTDANGALHVSLPAGSQAVGAQGIVAHDAAAAAVLPLLEGGYASAAAPADVSADNDAVRAWNLRNGARAVVLTAAGALIGGDAANGLDVDVTRMAALVTGAAVIGRVGIDQTTPGTTNLVAAVGSIAHDAAGAAVAPLLEGGYASAAAPADVSADNDAVRAWNLRNGARAVVLTAAGALIGGDAANGLDVDVTRMAALVTGSAIIGRVGIDQTTPGTTNLVAAVGSIAHDAAGAAVAPLLEGGYASAAAPADVSADNDAVRAWNLRNGARAVVLTAAGALIGGDAANGLDVDVTRIPGIVGTVAHDAVGTGANPLLEGGYASAAAPADVSTDGDAVRAWNLRNGARATVLTAAGALIGGDAANGLDVDVTRVPANPFGLNADIPSNAGSISAKLRWLCNAVAADFLFGVNVQKVGGMDGSGNIYALPFSDAAVPIFTLTQVAYVNTFTVTGTSAVNSSGMATKYHSMVVKQTGTVTSWTVELQGSYNQTNWFTILQHTKVTTGDGALVSGYVPVAAALTAAACVAVPTIYLRLNVTMTLGAGTNIQVEVMAIQ